MGVELSFYKGLVCRPGRQRKSSAKAEDWITCKPILTKSSDIPEDSISNIIFGYYWRFSNGPYSWMGQASNDRASIQTGWMMNALSILWWAWLLGLGCMAYMYKFGSYNKYRWGLMIIKLKIPQYLKDRSTLCIGQAKVCKLKISNVGHDVHSTNEGWEYDGGSIGSLS